MIISHNSTSNWKTISELSETRHIEFRLGVHSLQIQTEKYENRGAPESQ